MTQPSDLSVNLNVTCTDFSGYFLLEAKWGIKWTFFFIMEEMRRDSFKSRDLLLA